MNTTSLFKRTLSLMLALVMTLSFVACSNNQTPSDSTVSENSSAQSSSTDSQSSAESTITLTDQAGREIVMEPAETIVSCYYITTYATAWSFRLRHRP